jgi:peptidylprolyl isomerase
VLDKKRSQLQPVFNPEDSTMLSITKGERGESLIEELRAELVQLVIATSTHNATRTLIKQKGALLALGFIGELMVKEFPYSVPSKGKFSYLPRLLGRAKVTFRMKRRNSIIGNITIIADGYTAPITAGNFVDLALRNFYTGLPIKTMAKKFGPLSEQFAASINVMGSFNEGFYDPLTAKLRKIPLEIIIIEKGSGLPKLSYASRGMSESSLSDMSVEEEFLPYVNNKPLLTFQTPGLIAFNHPDKAPNSGSTEFFGLQSAKFLEDKNKLLDGEYAPFGFIIGGYDIFQSLEPGDIVDNTYVDEFGQLNLIKPRKSSFGEIVQGTEQGAA